MSALRRKAPSDLSESMLHTCMNKSSVQRIAQRASESTDVFEWLSDLTIHSGPPVNLKAAGALAVALDIDPDAGQPYVRTWIEMMSQGADDRVAREWLRGMLNMSLSEETQGRLFDLCISIMEGDHETGLIYNALRHAESIAGKYPELRQELIVLLDRLVHHESTSIAHRARNAMKKWK